MSDQKPYSAQNPYQGIVHSQRCLNGAGSAKDTRHIEVRVDGQLLPHRPGDSLGVLPRNNPELVERIIAWLGTADDTMVTLAKHSSPLPLREALCRGEITRIPKTLLDQVAERSSDASLRALADPQATDLRKAFCDGRDLWDVLALLPHGCLSPTELCAHVRPLLPRLYSIASSPLAHPNQIHLTVGIVTWESHGRVREGVASSYLGLRAPVGSSLEVFVHHAKKFQLPEDPQTDIIMVGPGTGIAPFRAFLQERLALGAQGRHWLFFGDQHVATDFLYGDEFSALHSDGSLHQLDLAFSRDQDYKIYVQHRIIERGEQLWRWIDDGAHFYVCGDALRMAKDVDQALHQIIRDHGGMDEDGAKQYVKAMKKGGRYLRDVYAI
ncbi:MAG: hypothetical protein EA401_11305 [Planctomycetota bacterium]|nr:MAG: hypothetical protein EA401_11305 [Planctomycetota bacterium]